MGLIDKLPDPHECYKNMPWPTLETISREEWGALPPTAVEEFETFPIKNVILGYTETDRCEDKESCISMMQELQKKHMAEGEPDIRFNYVIGWDERVYVGRGIKVKPGAHPRYPKLKGISVEFVLSGQRGELPRPGIKSAIMHILVDKFMFDGTISFTDSDYTLDYDESVEDDDKKLYAEVEELNKRSSRILEPLVKAFREEKGED